MARSPRAPTPTHRGRLSRRRRAAPHRADHDGEGLGEEELIVVDPGGRGPAAMGGQRHFLSEAAIHVDAHRRSRQAEVLVALSAQRTDTARVVGLDRHLGPGREPAHAGPESEHTAHQLMAHHARVVDGAIAGPDPVVGAAQTGALDPDHGFAGAGRKRRAGLDREISRRVEDSRDHGLRILPHDPRACRSDPVRAMRRVQLRGGARRQPARRTFCTLSRLSRAPYLRRWALIIVLTSGVAAVEKDRLTGHVARRGRGQVDGERPDLFQVAGRGAWARRAAAARGPWPGRTPPSSCR